MRVSYTTDIPKIRSVDKGMDCLVKSGSVDELVKSAVTAIKHEDPQEVNKKASHIESGPSKNINHNPNKKGTVSGRPPRRSTLVAENSAIDGTYTRYGCACCSSFVDYSMMYSILLFVNCSFQSHGLHPGVS